MRNGGCADDFQRLPDGGVYGSQQAAPRAVIPDTAGKTARIDAGQPGDSVLLQQLGQGLGVAEVGGHIVVVVHDHAADSGCFALKVVIGNAVVADEGVGHHDRLIGIGQIRNDLLVPDHGGVEHDLAHAVCRVSEPVAGVHTAVL